MKNRILLVTLLLLIALAGCKPAVTAAPIVVAAPTAVVAAATTVPVVVVAPVAKKSKKRGSNGETAAYAKAYANAALANQLLGESRYRTAPPPKPPKHAHKVKHSALGSFVYAAATPDTLDRYLIVYTDLRTNERGFLSQNGKPYVFQGLLACREMRDWAVRRSEQTQAGVGFECKSVGTMPLEGTNKAPVKA